jgi:4-amino-4-deoxy-L-arabinose transferase-like glycosyltransferase
MLRHPGARSASERIHGWVSSSRAALRRGPIIALCVVFLVGLALRLYFMHQWLPALIGFPDSSVYIVSARHGVFFDPLRVDGYAVFLKFLHALRPHLSFVIFVQHLMGLASGLLLFGAVRRAVRNEWVAFVPAAVVMLLGSELFLEHAVLTEPVFILLIDLTLYSIVRAWYGSWVWSIVAGLALGAAAIVRTVGLELLPFLLVAMVVTAPGAMRPRLLRGLVMLVLAGSVTFAYLAAHNNATGVFGFTSDGYFDLYGRVGPFADCSKFTPPRGTAFLCSKVPVKDRLGTSFWEFSPGSPAITRYGPPEFGPPPKPGENSALKRFSIAAIEGQPLDYLHWVGRDLVRIVDPEFSTSPYGKHGVRDGLYGAAPEGLPDYYFTPANAYQLHIDIAEEYPGDGYVERNMSVLKAYERDTRIEGPLMAVLLLLMLAAPFVTRGPERRAAFLFSSTAILLLVLPILVSQYDYRFTIPAFGPLTAAAAIAVSAMWHRWRTRRNAPAPPGVLEH